MAFLRLPDSGESGGLAGAVGCIENSPNSIDYNPALLTSIKYLSFSISPMILPGDIYYQNITSAYPVSLRLKDNKDVLAISIKYLTTGEMEIFNLSGESEGEISASDYSISFGYAKVIDEMINVGISARYIKSVLGDYSASVFATDIGGYTRLTLFKKTVLRIGLALQNIGTSIKYAEKSYGLPATLKLSLGSKFFENCYHAIYVSIDENLYPKEFSDNGLESNFGVEYTFKQLFRLRGGHKLNKNNNGWAVGAGIILKKIKKISSDSQFDWGMTYFSKFGASHFITITLRLNTIENKKE